VRLSRSQNGAGEIVSGDLSLPACELSARFPPGVGIANFTHDQRVRSPCFHRSPGSPYPIEAAAAAKEPFFAAGAKL
jgi:hypothetical protein